MVTVVVPTGHHIQISRDGGAFATRGGVKSGLHGFPVGALLVRMLGPRADADFRLVLVSP